MKQNIDNIFETHIKKTLTPLDYRVRKFNRLLALESSKVFETKPTLIKNEKKLAILRQIVEGLGKEDVYDYQDFLKYAIKEASDLKHQKFPTIEKIAAKVKTWKLITENGEVYKYIFWPTLTKNTGQIFNRDKNTYYGFYSDDLLENITQSSTFTIVMKELLQKFQKGELTEVTKEQLAELELLLASLIRYREKWKSLIPTFFKLWKCVKSLPITEKKYRREKEVKEDNKIYEV